MHVMYHVEDYWRYKRFDVVSMWPCSHGFAFDITVAWSYATSPDSEVKGTLR